METKLKPASRFDRLCHCATSLGYALLCSFFGLLFLLGISRLQWTRPTGGVPVLDNWAVLQGIWLPTMCAYCIMSWASEANHTVEAGFGPKQALHFVQTGVVLVPAVYGICAALLSANVDTKYYGLDIILMVVFVAVLDVTNDMRRKKRGEQEQELPAAAPASTEATEEAVTPSPTYGLRSAFEAMLEGISLVSAISILSFYPFVVVPTFFTGGTTTRLVVVLLLHPILLEATEALTRSSKAEHTSKRLKLKVITPEQAEREVMESNLGAFGLKQIMAFYRRLMLLGASASARRARTTLSPPDPILLTPAPLATPTADGLDRLVALRDRRHLDRAGRHARLRRRVRLCDTAHER